MISETHQYTTILISIKKKVLDLGCSNLVTCLLYHEGLSPNWSIRKIKRSMQHM